MSVEYLLLTDKLLLERGYVRICSNTKQLDPLAPYYAAKLLNKYGVVVDKPHLLNSTIVDLFTAFFGGRIPKSFYDNPQDLKHYTCDELLLEQLVSYFKIDYVAGAYSENKEDFDRIELFNKALPKRKAGKEVVLRKYKMLDTNECKEFFSQIIDNYCKYTRPWSSDEWNIFKSLYSSNCFYYNNQNIACKDNVITMYTYTQNEIFTKMMDKKDVVKLSINLINGEHKHFSYTFNEANLLLTAIKNAQDCPLSKKQAKYFNTIRKKIQLMFIKTTRRTILERTTKATNSKSPYKLAKDKLKDGDVLGAAKIFAQNGSLLERNLVWLLSRASSEEIPEIINLIKADNPIVLYQILQGCINDDYNTPRIFVFFNEGKTKSHVETGYEAKYRKSKLSIEVKNQLINILKEKISSSYKKMPKLGKIYISEEFKNIALPTNTSATGRGLDVLPIGSRIKFDCDYIRTFCYWNDVYDIDTSALILKDLNDTNQFDYFSSVLSWQTYSTKPFGKSALYSGDDRGDTGSEFQDFKISELLKNGFKYVIYGLNGYGGPLNKGEIYCGYQNKNDLDTEAWSPKNIALKIHVYGDSNTYLGFGIDLENKEIVIFNQICANSSQVFNPRNINQVKGYFNKSFLEAFNMYNLLSLRGEIVENIEDADYVFDRNYIGKDNQEVVKPSDIEKLVKLINK